MNTPDRHSSPLVTIITVTYQAAATLPLTMRSLEEQTYQGFEHLIIDGASSDQTLAEARKSTIKSRILSEPDNGLYFAMNKGLDLAQGEFILFLNAGDAFFAPDSLEKYVKAIESKKPDIVYGDTAVSDIEGNILRPRHLKAPETLTPESFSHGMLICHQAFMVRRKLAPKFNTDYRFSADYDWTIECIKRTTSKHCVNLHATVIRFLDEGTTSKNKLKSLRERFSIMSEHYGLVKTIGRHLSFIPRALSRGKL